MTRRLPAVVGAERVHVPGHDEPGPQKVVCRTTGVDMLATFIRMERAWALPVTPFASVGVRLKLYVLAVVGVPLMVQPLRDKPAGREPLVTAQVITPAPPLVLRVCAYETLTWPAERLVVVILGAPLTIRDTESAAVL